MDGTYVVLFLAACMFVISLVNLVVNLMDKMKK